MLGFRTLYNYRSYHNFLFDKILSITRRRARLQLYDFIFDEFDIVRKITARFAENCSRRPTLEILQISMINCSVR